MPKEMPIAGIYVITESGTEHMLEYCICSQASRNKTTDYGVTIKQHPTIF